MSHHKIVKSRRHSSKRKKPKKVVSHKLKFK